MMIDALVNCYSREKDTWRRATEAINDARAERDMALSELERLRREEART
jgi:tRNA uridine 5-carbamoylmethylation protein Kti12